MLRGKLDDYGEISAPYVRNFMSYDEIEEALTNEIKSKTIFDLQEQLKKFSEYDEKYSTGDTVSVHSIAFSILTGCNPIYIIGADLDYNKGYANHSGSFYMTPSQSIENKYKNNILNDYRILNESAKKINTNIINLNKNTSFDMFTIGDLK
jgi:hypothetical protein